MKKVFYTMMLSLFSAFSLFAQLPAIGGGGTFNSRNYRYRLKTIIEHRSDTEARRSYTYNADGFVQEENVSTHIPADNERAVFVYNEKKQLVELRRERGENYEIKEGKVTYLYDESGRLSKSTNWVWVPENSEYAELNRQAYSYEGTATMPANIKHEYRNLVTGELGVSNIFLTYNEKNRPLTILNKTVDNRIASTCTIEYDGQNRIAKMHLEATDPRTGETEVTDRVYSYEANGNLLKTGQGDFINYLSYDDSKKGNETYYPSQFIDFFAVVGGDLTTSFFVYKVPYDGLAHQLKEVRATNGAQSPAEKEFEFEYEENSVLSINVPKHGVANCHLYVQEEQLFAKVDNTSLGRDFALFDAFGLMVASGKLVEERTLLGKFPSGTYVFSIEGTAYKVII